MAALALAVAAGLLAAGEPGLDFITSAGYEALMVRPDGTITHSEEFAFARARPMGLDSAQSPQADNPTSNRVISAPIV